MKRTLHLATFCVALGLAFLHAEPPVTPAPASPPPSPPTATVSSSAGRVQTIQVAGPYPAKRRTVEIQGEKIAEVLRSLARQANRSLVVDAQVTGTVAIYLANKTPMEAIETVVGAEDLHMEDQHGVLMIRPNHPLPPGAEVKAPEPKDPMTDLATAFAPMLFGFFDSMLDYVARPETAQKIAKGKKTLYDACLAEGFTKDEAFRLTVSGHEIPFSEMAK